MGGLADARGACGPYVSCMTQTPPAQTADDVALKAKHAAMWAMGDYPAVATEVIAALGPSWSPPPASAPGEHVLDIAAGSGNASIPAAQAGADVVASDLTPDLIETGRQAASAAGVEEEPVGRWTTPSSCRTPTPSSEKSAGVGADDLEHEAHGVAHLGEQGDPALEVGAGDQLLEALHLAGLLGVVGDAGQAALPGHVAGEVRVPGPVLQRLDQVRVAVGDLAGVQLLDPAQVDHPRGHPVGHARSCPA